MHSCGIPKRGPLALRNSHMACVQLLFLKLFLVKGSRGGVSRRWKYCLGHTDGRAVKDSDPGLVGCFGA